MAAFAAAPFRGRGLSSVVVSTTFGATNRLPSIVESRYAGDYIPKFQAKFGVAEEEPDGPMLGPPPAPANHASTVTSTHPGASLMGVSLEMELTTAGRYRPSIWSTNKR